MKRKLIFFTITFPYIEGREDCFILPELPILSENFDEIIIVPSIAKGLSIPLDQFENIKVDTSLSVTLLHQGLVRKMKRVFQCIFSLKFVRALYQDKSFFSYKKIRILLTDLCYALGVRDWLISYFKSAEKHEEFFLYSYWFNNAVLGGCLFEDYRIKKRITRAHNFDLYDFRVDFRSIFFRKFVLSKITNVYSVSSAGVDYLQNKFPEFSDRIKKMYLGIEGKGIPNMVYRNRGNELFIFSCSYMVPVKRNDLLAEYIIKLANRYPHHYIVWTHAGGGPLLNKVKQIVDDGKKDNLNVHFLGSLSHSEVIEYYSSHPVDVFVSLTKVEGLPVSMMEAQSFGVPIVATNVGGIAEIVLDGQTGFLLEEYPGIDEFIDKMSYFINKSNFNVTELREKSFLNWKNNFDAKKNHTDFVNEILKN